MSTARYTDLYWYPNIPSNDGEKVFISRLVEMKEDGVLKIILFAQEKLEDEEFSKLKDSLSKELFKQPYKTNKIWLDKLFETEASGWLDKWVKNNSGMTSLQATPIQYLENASIGKLIRHAPPRCNMYISPKRENYQWKMTKP